MGRGDRRKCKCCLKLSYFVLPPVTAVTNFTVRRLAAERPARPLAKPVGSLSPRTKVIYAAP
jgi:hypothetical protein